jgi:hypothetical protein
MVSPAYLAVETGHARPLEEGQYITVAVYFQGIVPLVRLAILPTALEPRASELCSASECLSKAAREC